MLIDLLFYYHRRSCRSDRFFRQFAGRQAGTGIGSKARSVLARLVGVLPAHGHQPINREGLIRASDPGKSTGMAAGRHLHSEREISMFRVCVVYSFDAAENFG